MGLHERMGGYNQNVGQPHTGAARASAAQRYRSTHAGRAILGSWQANSELLSIEGLKADQLRPISNPMENELTDAKIAAAEARTDAKFADLRGEFRAGFSDLSGKMEVILARMEASAQFSEALRTEVRETKATVRSENVTTRWTIAVSLVALVASVIGLWAYAGDQLGRGVDWRDKLQTAVEQEVVRKISPVQPQSVATPAPAAPNPSAPSDAGR